MHTPGAPWTKADVAAMLDEHGSAAAAAKAAGVSTIVAVANRT